MVFSPLTSKQVLEFLPMNTWTEIDLYPSDLKNVYIATTKDKIEKRKEDEQLISLNSDYLERVKEFKAFKIVGVQINGEWHRGRLISFNEFKTDNTRIELIDVGSVCSTKLENVFRLPYFFMYGPLVLPITFKDFIPKTTRFCIKPLLSESNLSEGVVLVDVNCKDTNLENALNEQQQIKSIKYFNSANDSKMVTVQNITNDNCESLGNNDSSLYVPYKIPLKNKDYCIITFVEDYNHLYVCKAITQPKYDGTLSYKFCDSYLVTDTYNGTDKILKIHPVVGNMVKVFSSTSQGLFRAKILKKNKNGSYNVFYIDYGNQETVPSNVIYELADKLKKPGLAVRIHLNNLKSIDKTNKVKKMFEDFSEIGKPFIIEFGAQNTHTCLENVELKDIKNGSYIDYNYVNQFITK